MPKPSQTIQRTKNLTIFVAITKQYQYGKR